MKWDKQKKDIIKKYQEQFKKYGFNNKSLFTPGIKQNIRFKAIQEIGINSNDSILDVGCGFGDLLQYLNSTIDYKGAYTGVDIMEEFINVCKEFYPLDDFRVLDILDKNNSIEEKWDYVVLSGTLNINVGENHLEYVKTMISKMFDLSVKGVSIDFVSIEGDDRNKEIYRMDPEIIFRFAKTLTKRVVLRNDYLPWEFSVYLYKDDAITSDKVYSDYHFDEVIKYNNK